MPLLLLNNWRLILEVVVVGLLAFYAGTMRLERDAIRTEYAEYRTQVAQAAQAAAEQALQKTIADEHRKEAADAENMRLRADLDTTTRKLRDARRDSQFVPAATAGTASPALACFDRDSLESAIRGLDQEVQGIVDKGSQAMIDLDTARRWVQER